MKKMLVIGCLFLSFNCFAKDIVCTVKTALGVNQVTIKEDSVIVDLPFYSQPRVFQDLKHANGLITSKGLAIYSENHYGCIRNVLVITDFREPFDAGYMSKLNFGTCRGGSTPDELCLRD